MSFLSLLLLLLVSINGIRSIPSALVFSYSNDHQHTVSSHLHQFCSNLGNDQQYLCSNEIIKYVPYHFSAILAPRQSDMNDCVLILQSYPSKIMRANIENTSYFMKLPFERRISIDSTDWNKSLLIFIYNHMQDKNFCSIELPSIGSNCSLRTNVPIINVSCYFNRKESRIDDSIQRFDQSIELINQTQMTHARLNSHLLGFLVMIIGLTSIPWLLFLTHLFYIERIQKNLPAHLQYYDQQIDTNNEPEIL